MIDRSSLWWRFLQLIQPAMGLSSSNTSSSSVSASSILTAISHQEQLTKTDRPQNSTLLQYIFVISRFLRLFAIMTQ